MKGGSFQFECPRCKCLLQVSAAKQKFKCPTCKAAYGLSLQVEDVEQEGKGKADFKSRTLKDELYILSQFEKELRFDRKDVGTDCDRHEYSEKDCSGTMSYLCLQCKKRLCKQCNEKVHQHPELRGHAQLNRKVFVQSKAMFFSLTSQLQKENKDNLRQEAEKIRVPCALIRKSLKKYYKDKQLRKNIFLLVYADMDKFGKNYGLTFEEYLYELGLFLMRSSKNREILDQLKSGRLKEETLIQQEASEWQALSWFGKKLYDLQIASKGWRSRQDSRIWSKHIRSIEAHKGKSISTFFSFIRWMFLLNTLVALIYLLTIMMPQIVYMAQGNTAGSGYDYAGLLVGYGFGGPDSFFFYGGYKSTYFNGNYDMRVAWVLVALTFILLSFTATLLHMDSSSGSSPSATTFASRATGDSDARFSFAGLVFGEMDHYNAAKRKRPMELARETVKTSLETMLREAELRSKYSKQKSRRCAGCCRANSRLWARAIFLCVVAANVFLVYWLIYYEVNQIVNEWGSNTRFKYMLVPTLIAICKVFFPELIRYLMYFESLPRKVFAKHFFWRVIFIRIGSILFILFAIVEAGVSLSSASSGDSIDVCPESETGILFYRLFLADFLVEVFLCALWPFFRISSLRRIADVWDPLALEHSAEAWKKYDDELEQQGKAMGRRSRGDSLLQANRPARLSVSGLRNQPSPSASPVASPSYLKNREHRQQNSISQFSAVSERDEDLLLPGAVEGFDAPPPYAAPPPPPPPPAPLEKAPSVRGVQRRSRGASLNPDDIEGKGGRRRASSIEMHVSKSGKQHSRKHSRNISSVLDQVGHDELQGVLWSASRERKLSEVSDKVEMSRVSPLPPKKIKASGIQRGFAANEEELEVDGSGNNLQSASFYNEPLRRTDTSYEVEMRHQNRFKKEFDIPLAIADLLYIQALILCGCFYAPILPVISPLIFLAMFHIKRIDVMHFTTTPRVALSTNRQGRFFRSAFTATLILAIVPFQLFLRRRPTCGPHAGLVGEPTILEATLSEISELPTWFTIVLDYLTSVVLLWMVLLLGWIYILTYRRREGLVAKEIEHTKLRLRLEAAERKKIIEVYGVQVGRHEARGKELFVDWAETMPKFIAERYMTRLQSIGYGDLIKLCTLNESQLDGILQRIGARGGVQEQFKKALADQRRAMVYLSAKGS